MKQYLLTFPKQRKTKQAKGSTQLQDQEEYVSGATYLARFSKHSMLGRIASFNRQLDPASDSNMYFLLNRTRVGATVTFPQGAKCMFGDCPLGESAPSCGTCGAFVEQPDICLNGTFYLYFSSLGVLIVIETNGVVVSGTMGPCNFTGNYYNSEYCGALACAQMIALWYYTPAGVPGYNPTIFKDDRTGLTYTVSDFVSAGNVVQTYMPYGCVVVSGLSLTNVNVNLQTMMNNNFAPFPYPLSDQANCEPEAPLNYNSSNSTDCTISFSSPTNPLCADCLITTQPGQDCMVPTYYIIFGDLNIYLTITITPPTMVGLTGAVNGASSAETCCFTGNAYGNCSCGDLAALQLLVMWYYTPSGVEGYNPTIFKDLTTNLTYTISDLIQNEECFVTTYQDTALSQVDSIQFQNAIFNPTIVIENNFSPAVNPFSSPCSSQAGYPQTVYNDTNSTDCVITFSSD